jgi:hypothetical protein
MSLKAYSETGLYNERVRRTAKTWLKQGLLLPEQAAAINGAYPSDFYRPLFFIKVGLFLFTLIGCFACAGMLTLLFGESTHYDSTAFLLLDALLCGGIAIGVLEMLISSSRLHHSGPDNALLYFALGSFLTALAFFYFEVLKVSSDSTTLISNGLLWWLLLPVALLFFVATVRYADALTAAACYLTVLGSIAAFALQFSLGKLLLPFVLMLASFGAYKLSKVLYRRPDFLYYETCLRTFKALALLTLYLGGNYLVVREANAAINDLPLSVQVGFAPLFYLFTAAIPVLYVVLGLRKPDRIFLHLGLLTFGFSLYTYRHYRALLPTEVALTLGGALLVLLAGACLRYLRKPKHGLTAAAEPTQNQLNLESLVMVQVAKPVAAPAGGFQFGGGQSGGGGATGSY